MFIYLCVSILFCYSFKVDRWKQKVKKQRQQRTSTGIYITFHPIYNSLMFHIYIYVCMLFIQVELLKSLLWYASIHIYTTTETYTHIHCMTRNLFVFLNIYSIVFMIYIIILEQDYRCSFQQGSR